MTSLPTHTPQERAYARIVVALDGSPASRHALAWARDVARLTSAEVVPVGVVVPPYVEGAAGLGGGGGWAYANLLDAERDRVGDMVRDASDALAGEGIASHALVSVGPPAERIAHAARREKADLVVVGSHGRGPLGRLLLGSVADAVKTHVACDVLIARTPPRSGEVLAAVDGSRPSAIAAATASRIAAAWRARLTVLHVVDRLSSPPFSREGLILPPGAAAVTYVTSTGNPAERIVAYAREHAVSLVAMGSRGLGNVGGALVGSVSNRVAHESAASVLLVKEGRP